MRNVPFIIKSTGNSFEPYILEPIACDQCAGKNFNYTMGSTILTIFVGATAFFVALIWATFFREVWEEKCKNDDQLIASQLNFTTISTMIAILIIFTLLYFIDGQKC